MYGDHDRNCDQIGGLRLRTFGESEAVQSLGLVCSRRKRLRFFVELESQVSVACKATMMWCIDFLYFVSFGLSSYCWLIFTESRINKSILKSKSILTLLLVPLAVLVTLLIASYFNGCLLYFDAAGNYHRGSLFYLQQILSYCYFFISSLRCLTAILKKRKLSSPS